MPTVIEPVPFSERVRIDESSERDDSWLQPARGIAIGVLLGLLAWSVIGLVVWAIFS